MFFNNSKRARKETLIKESLISQLSNAVKEIQLLNSQDERVFSTNEAASTILVILESIFLHGVKRGIFQNAMSSSTVGGVEETKPQPSYWSAVANYTHRNTIANINKLTNIHTDVGRSRAWIRLALNQTELTSYLEAMMKEKRIINGAYYNYAFLRDKDTLDTAITLLQGIVHVQFDTPVNTSLLNRWSNEPLMLSGIWSPSLKSTPISAGTDVAESLASDDDTCSIRTASSMSSLVGISALDENQVLKLILETPFQLKEPEEEEEVVQTPQENSETSSTTTTTTPSITKDEELSETECNIGNSLSRTGWSCINELDEEGVEDRPIVEEKKPEQVENDTSLDNRTYTNIVQAYGSPRSTPFNYKEMLTSLVPSVDNSDSEYEVVNSRSCGDELEEYYFKIINEKSLNEQNYACAQCHLAIGLSFDTAVLCHYTKKYYCTLCHQNQTFVIPSRVIYNWDLKKYPVCVEAYTYLQEAQHKPLIDIKSRNVKLYQVVEKMNEMNVLRLQLNLLRAYLYTCREPVILELQKRVWPREYLYEQIHVYSLSDLKKVASASLANELQPGVKFAREHVLNCWLCSQKGFICEICKNPKIIYPFDCGSTFRCNKCYSVYHGECLKKIRKCPKCKRKEERIVGEES